MKKVTGVFVLICLLLTNLGVFAEESTINKYTVEYVSGCDTAVAGTVVTGYSEVLECEISRVRPKKAGYEFLGWSFSERDYVNDAIFAPGETVKISDSVKLFAIWEDLNQKKLSYMDGYVEILPAQLVFSDSAEVSEIVPKKSGYVFAGWTFSDSEGSRTVFPGETLNLEKSTVLIASWKRGDFELPLLQKTEGSDGETVFVCDNVNDFDAAELKIQSLGKETQKEYLFREGEVRVTDLDEGAYVAWIDAKKYGIDYKSEKLNFVVAEKNAEESQLAVLMDGKKLAFDLPPVILDGHTFVTLRYFCEYLGADVLWDDASRTAIITYNGTRMKIKENSDICVVDGATYKLAAKTVILSSRLFIPLRSVAELFNCEVVWDPSRKVYMFSEQVNVFDKNIFSINGNNEKYLSYSDGALEGSRTVDFSAMWVFDVVDEAKEIYEIYNFSEMTKPLEVKLSEAKDNQPVRIWEKSGFDGCLWKVTNCGKDEYLIQPANNSSFYLDAANRCITTDETITYLKGVYR
ncbi:MAG: copper amine oxidase N-terminal domain-containing protein [Clostridia bacterium]|nr:copper amine oxidase N-terminal domain-containing protein [Clostridia bacterium]